MKKFYIISLLAAFIGLSQGVSLAATISALPLDGSSRLRLEAKPSGLNNRKEIRVRVNATGGHRYQVFQRVLEPIVNEKGQSMDLQALQTATTSNSNASGTLYGQQIERLTFAEQLLYTSAQNGESDSFVVSYAPDQALLKYSGSFNGRIIFSVRETGGNSQDATVPIVLDVAASQKINVTGGHIPGRVRVRDTDTDRNADFVKIDIVGNSGDEVRVYQEFESFPQSSMADEMGQGVLKFFVSGDDGVSIRDAVAGRAPVLIYSGRKSETSLRVSWLLNQDLAKEQDAGQYTGKIRYIVETSAGRETFLIDMECQVQSVFTVDVTLPPEGVSFPKVLADMPPMEKIVQVKVRSNLHRPYQVTQALQTLLTNEKGDQLKKEAFTIKVELPAEQKGRTRFINPLPAEPGEYPVFSSDGEGSSAEFKVIYRLQGYAQMAGGSYAAPIRFSLDQN